MRCLEVLFCIGWGKSCDGNIIHTNNAIGMDLPEPVFVYVYVCENTFLCIRPYYTTVLKCNVIMCSVDFKGT